MCHQYSQYTMSLQYIINTIIHYCSHNWMGYWQVVGIVDIDIHMEEAYHCHYSNTMSSLSSSDTCSAKNLE